MGTMISPLSVPTCVGQCRQSGTEGHENCIYIDWSTAVIKTGKCRSGCPTKDHKSYAECCKGIQIDPKGSNLTFQQKSHDAELAAYAAARSEGIQPMGTKMKQVEQAKRISDATGVAFGV